MLSLIQRSNDPAWRGHLQTDCGAFESRAGDFLDDRSWEGMKSNEYQPGALWIFAAVGGAAPAGEFVSALIIFNAILLFAHIWLAWRFGGGGHGWVMLGLIAGMGPILLFRFEAVVSLMVILSVLYSKGTLFQGSAVAGSLLGAAIITKLYPLLLLPGLLGRVWKRNGGLVLVACALSAMVGGMLPVLAWLAWGGTIGGLGESVRYHFDKPVGVDGFWGSLFPLIQWGVDEPLKMASRNAIHGFDPVIPGIPGWVLQSVTWVWVPICTVLVISTVISKRGRFAHSPGAVFAVMGTYVALAKLSTPQYIWWALPLVAFVPSRWFTDREKVILFFSLAGCLTLGQLVFPLGYSEFLSSFHQGKHLGNTQFWINASKNFLWLLSVAVGVMALARNLSRGRSKNLISCEPGNIIPSSMKTNALSHSSLSLGLAVLGTLVLTGCKPPPPAPAPQAQDVQKAQPEESTTEKVDAGKEKFASVEVIRNASNSQDAEAFIKNFDGSVDVKLGPDQANDHQDEGGTCASWIYHSPLEDVTRADGNPFPDTKQLSVDGDGVYIWTKTQHRGLPGFKGAVYYRTDGKEPFGSRGQGEDATQVTTLEYSHNSPSGADGSDSWWRVGPLPAPQGENSFTYKIGLWRE